MSSSSQIVESWISSFCNITGHEYFAEVSEDFVEDDFNLTGLSSQVGGRYKEALEMILDVEPDEDDLIDEDEDDDDDEDDMVEVIGEDGQSLGFRKATKDPEQRAEDRLNNNLSAIESSAELLYGLIHQRYITSRPGIGQMHEKYELGHFGVCPRVHCNGCRVLPVGLSDTPGQETVKLFCPSCLDVYTPPNSRFQTVDGAFFGTTFGCLFFMTYPELQVDQTRRLDTIAPSSDIGSDDEGLEEEAGTLPYATSQQRAAQVMNSTVPQPTEINGMATSNLAPGLGKGNYYEPKVYGFKVAEISRAGPRMKWLRLRPDDITELDEVARFAEGDGEDAEASDDGTGAAQAVAVQQQVDRRKKAPIRRRRRVTNDEVAEDRGANGVNGVG